MKKIKRKVTLLFLRFSMLFPFFLSDERFLKIMFKYHIGKQLDLKNPTTFNEKLQWLKLHDRKPEYTEMVDKYEAKKFISNIVGKEHVIPTLGVWNNFEEIDFNTLPDQFVLKTTHDSGGVIICENKSTFNYKSAKKILNKSLKRNYWVYEREWPYKNVKRRIIAEKYMVDESNTELKDYKFFCFDGVPKYMFIASGRKTKLHFDFFDMEFNHLAFINGKPNSLKPHTKPKGYYEMKEMAINLSQNIPHVRVDFYDINGHVYVGELTLYHHGGFVPFDPEIWDYNFGKEIILPIDKLD